MPGILSAKATVTDTPASAAVTAHSVGKYRRVHFVPEVPLYVGAVAETTLVRTRAGEPISNQVSLDGGDDCGKLAAETMNAQRSRPAPGKSYRLCYRSYGAGPHAAASVALGHFPDDEENTATCNRILQIPDGAEDRLMNRHARLALLG